MVELLLWIVGAYLYAGIGVYGYAVFKSWEYTRIWSFNIGDNFIGICEYPKWLLGWVYWIKQKVVS